MQITVVVPTGNSDPDGGAQVTVPHVPEVPGAGYVTVAPQIFGVLFTVISEGQVNVQLIPQDNI